jgi:hypothetical protein
MRATQASTTRPVDAGAAESQLEGFVGKFDPAVAALIRASRAVLRRRLPTAIELVYDNFQFLAIGYCATERTSSCIVSLASAANGVSLSFYRGATLADPDHVLLGAGTQNRFVRLPTAARLSDPDVEALIAGAVSQADPPLAATGGGYTVIKSISAKQRPRR